MFVAPLEIKTSITDLARILDHYQDFVWLDSADQNGFSVLAFQSRQTRRFNFTDEKTSFQDFLKSIVPTRNSETNTFSPSWIGYFSYECFGFNDLLPLNLRHKKNYPLAEFSYFDTYFIWNHHDDSCCFHYSLAKDISIFNDISNKLKTFKSDSKKSYTKPFTPFCRSLYKKQIKNIKEALSNGDYFELNYTYEIETEFNGSALDLYIDLRQTAAAPMMSYLKTSAVTILSASPERFFQIKNNHILTEPIKGTIKRGETSQADKLNSKILEESSKDRAELLMVTDLLRNDLGRICKGGSIHVEEFAKVRTFSHYHHLVSKISGVLKDDITALDIFSALFPGGSITGAPKIQVMNHIQELEDRARGVYTGAVGYMSTSGQMDFSIPIRTLTLEDKKLTYSAGSGIVADSDPENEYDECLLKTKAIEHALGLSN